jgi:hypothetical protein
MRIGTLAIFAVLFALGVGNAGPVLGIDGERFTLDGKPTFLPGASYYGALGVEDARVWEKDLDDLIARGFNWIRVWATWEYDGVNVSAVDGGGRPRRPYMKRLKALCHLAGEKGMVVDVTVTRGKPPDFPATLDEHFAVMGALTNALMPCRNVYFDVGNERNIGDQRRVPFEEVGQVIERIKRIDQGRLCTASHGGDIGAEDLIKYVEVGKVDFVCPHRPRDAESAKHTEELTREYSARLRSGPRTMPVHYQEPFRRDYGPWNPVAADFMMDLQGAREGGAAGWCFHNGAAGKKPDGRPRRSFDMRPSEGRLFDQLDSEERAFISGFGFRVSGLGSSPDGPGLRPPPP